MSQDPSFWVNKMDSQADPEKHVKERSVHGFSTYDWWNFCDYLAWVNIEGLKRFKTEGHGHPGDVTWDEWVVELDTMIAGFEAHLKISEYEWEAREELDELVKARETGLELYAKRFPSLWD
jgi:hypothetical protein